MPTTHSTLPRPAAFYSARRYGAEDSVGYLMRKVTMSMAAAIDRRLESIGLTNAQWVPLLKLYLGKAVAVAELARECEIDAGAMTRLLDRLEKKGLCTRVRSTEDRRVVMVELTAEGKAAMEHVPEVLADVMNQHLTGFSKTEWQALLGYLRRMVETGEALKDSG